MIDLISVLCLLCVGHSLSQLSYASGPKEVEAEPTQGLFSVADFGARGDGKHHDTRPIQAAIHACYAAGGGHVIFPPGTYLTGTVFMRSGVILQVNKGAIILGATEQNMYPPEQSRWYVILAENATDVGITGGGEINGQGWTFVERNDARKNVMRSWNRTGGCLGDECRPRLVGFIDSSRIRIWNVRMVEPAYWCLHIVRCQNTTITDVSIKGNFDTPNNDGIDVEDSNRTFITRCHIDTGDDAICPKSSIGATKDLVVTDCWIRTKSSAIKLGSASWVDFSDFVFDNITIFDSHRGLALQIRDGASARNITFSNMRITTRYYDQSWWGRAEPIYITNCARDGNSRVGHISDVRFINISSVSENGILLSGCEGGSLTDVEFKNVNLTYRRWTNFTGGLVDYRPGCRGLVNHSTAGIQVEHVVGLRMEHVNMRWYKSRSQIWDMPLGFKPSTVDGILFRDFRSDVTIRAST